MSFENSVFIHVPKTAGTYVMFALGIKRYILPRHRKVFQPEQTGHITFGHQDYARLINLGVVSKDYNYSAFKYAFCRNPFDRAVSHYFYAQLRHPEILDKSVGFLEYTRNLHKYRRSANRKQRYGAKLVFRPQYECVKGIALDFIGRFESLSADLTKLGKILGLPLLKVPDIRHNSTEHEHYSRYYNEESAENVRNFYAIDFEKFGYDNRLLPAV